ncbi:MAG: hypothetical protein ACP5N3_05715 [Candidatus Nanoarchaeia archaeon]
MRGVLNRLVIIILVLVMLIPFVSAEVEQKEVHNAWHKYDDTFTIDGRVFALRLSDADNELLRVKIDDDSVLFINLGLCKRYDVYEVCYLEKDLEASTATYIGVSVIPGIKVKVLKDVVPELDLTVSHTVSPLVIEGEGTVEVVFKNTKDTKIDSFSYELTLPVGVEVTDRNNFGGTGRKLTYSDGPFEAGRESKQKFEFHVKSNGTFRANHSMSFEGVEQQKNKTGTVDFVVPLPYTVAMSLTPATSEIMEQSKLLITVKNIGNEDLIVEGVFANASLPITVVKFKELSVYGYKQYALPKQDVIKPGNTSEYFINFIVYDTGTYSLNGRVNLEYEGYNFYNTYNYSVTYSANGIAPSVMTNKDEVLAGEEIEVVFFISNTDDDLHFTDMGIVMDGGFFNETLGLDKLGPGGAKELMRKRYTAPLVETDTSYKINAEIQYLTSAKERKYINSSKTIKVTGRGSLVSVDQRVSATEIIRGQEVVVETFVKNLKEEPFEVSAYDVIPSGAEVIGGSTSASMTLRGKQEEKFYSYKLLIPPNSTMSEINLLSNASVPDRIYEKTDSSKVKITENLSAPPVVVTTTPVTPEVNTSDIVVTPTEGEKKESGFKKFFKSIDKFFKNLFS